MDGTVRTGAWWHDPWWRWGVLAVVAITLVALPVGFIWMPSAAGGIGAEGLWAGICRAAGVPQRRWGRPVASTGAPNTGVVLVALAHTATADSGHGATLALQRCSMCHGDHGIAQADAPNLAGQHPEVIEKQLADYRHADRSSSIMQAMAGALSDADVADLAAYYTALPPKPPAAVRDAPPALVRVGDAMRNIAACASCHGGTGRKLGAPWLDGLPRAYLAGQLTAFAAGTRHNDSHAQMRNMARRLSGAEIDALATWYAGR